MSRRPSFEVKLSAHTTDHSCLATACKSSRLKRRDQIARGSRALGRQSIAIRALSIYPLEDQKTIELNESTVANTADLEVHTLVSTYAPNGVVLGGCGVEFDNVPNVPKALKSNNNHLLYFVGGRGTYDVTTSYPVFKSARARVLRLPPEGSSLAEDSIQTITLKRK